MRSSLLLTTVLPVALASPLSERGTFCDQWGSESAGPYTVYNNLWGADAADPGGAQCTTNNGLDGRGAISWSTAWSWSGGPYSVKSYANVVVANEYPKLGDVRSMPTEWNWKYTGNGIVANVAYDVFTGSVASSDFQDHDYEFMIWLGALGGAGPISRTGQPVATVTLAGVHWKLYEGPNGSMQVFSFVADANVENFSGDLVDFTEYLMREQGVSRDQLLQGVGAGTEPFVGSNAVFTTSKYSVSIN